MRCVFFGTPAFAVPTLEALVAAGMAPLRVISQPSRPAGRGFRLQEPPVVEAARRLGIEVAQVEEVRSPEFLAGLRALAPDVAVVAAFGQIFRAELLALPSFGCLNVHASLLPKYRGAAPIHAAIAAGDDTTGITVMRMARGLDSGPMLARASLVIGDDERTEELSERLARLGAELMVEVLRRLAAGPLPEQPQDDRLATFAPRLVKQDGEVDWRWPARRIYDRWRAFSVWPGLQATLRDQTLKLVEVAKPAAAATEAPPGTILGLREGGLAVACGGGSMAIVPRVQRAGRAAITAAEFWRGEHLRESELFALPTAGC